MSAKKPPTEKIGNVPPFGLRMLPALKQQIEDAARRNGRSTNAEIVARLEMSLRADDDPKAAYREMRDAKALREAQEEMARFRRTMERLEEHIAKIEGEEFAERIERIVRNSRKERS